MEAIIPAKQYEMLELGFIGPEPAGSQVQVDLCGRFTRGERTWTVPGFYAGNGTYRLRFLPEEAGEYGLTVTGSILDAPQTAKVVSAAAAAGRHGPVRAEGTHLRHADGTWFHGFGTTVYAMAHQSRALMEETFQSLENGPFNKIRMCVFPKHYVYNTNNPEFYPFQVKEGREEKSFDAAGLPLFPIEQPERDSYWDVHMPSYDFWDAFEDKLRRMEKLNIQVDLILFHPYDRWGFANLTQEDNLVYLDYLLRRFSAFPHLWWSLANEYDLVAARSLADWHEIEEFVAAHDPYHHLLGNHQCFLIYDPSRKNITHMSWQTKQLFRVGEMQRKYGKPVLIDECRYEGNIPEFFGNLSGQDMTRSFWKVTTQGGYCTHGETYLPGTPEGDAATATGEQDVVWWARGGILHGQSPARIGFLRGIIESLPGPLEPLGAGMSGILGMTDEEIRRSAVDLPEYLAPMLRTICSMERAERDGFFAVEFEYNGHCGDDAFLRYLDDQCCALTRMNLPENHSYRVEVIDTWEMTRETVLENASGLTEVRLPGKPWMAVLAVRTD